MIEIAGSRFVAVLDASVLYSIRATNFLLEVAANQLFQPRWSDAIHAEWTRNLLAKNPASDPAKIAHGPIQARQHVQEREIRVRHWPLAGPLGMKRGAGCGSLSAVSSAQRSLSLGAPQARY